MTLRNVVAIAVLIWLFFLPLVAWFFFDAPNWWLLVAAAGVWVAEFIGEFE